MKLLIRIQKITILFVFALMRTAIVSVFARPADQASHISQHETAEQVQKVRIG